MDPMGIAPKAKPDGVETEFKKELHLISNPVVLELGTMRSNPNVATHHKLWLPDVSTHVKSDVFDGIDVDIVADAHTLEPFDDNYFDAVIAVSVWEHLARPWIAAEAVHRVLKPNGLVYVATHQTFPIHGYPSDYFRFTTEAMKILFGEPLFKDCVTSYQFPCSIKPPAEVTRWNPAAPAFLNVDCFSRKV